MPEDVRRRAAGRRASWRYSPSGNDGGHSIHLRDLGRRGVRLHGRFEGADDGILVFSDDLPGRLELVEAGFGRRLKPMADAYIEAAGIGAPVAEPPQHDSWLPVESGTRLNLDAENVTSIIWATGYGLDFSFLDIPVLDEWNYPRHSRGVAEVAGLYAVGLQRIERPIGWTSHNFSHPRRPWAKAGSAAFAPLT